VQRFWRFTIVAKTKHSLKMLRVFWGGAATILIFKQTKVGEGVMAPI
jgi:hypothetical protein